MFIFALYCSCFICLLLFLLANTFSNKPETSVSATFRSFQKTYLLVYLLATGGDWLQGPHVYALYESYGMTKHEIELLFIAGYGSSLLFGTFVGSIADKYGRRRNCFLYGILYGVACVTKHFGNFWILFFGRLLCGISTSILYSAFESWAVCEHGTRGFDEESLPLLFGFATLGNSLVAVGAGIVAQFAADRFGFVAPFDVALSVLLFMCIVMVFTWSENFGDAKGSFGDPFKEAWRCLKEDRRILCLGLVQSLFEGTMYTFVLEWTPSLTRAAIVYNQNIPEDPTSSAVASSATAVMTKGILNKEQIPAIPHGFVFATFMVAVMTGSSIFRILCRYFRPASFLRFVLLAAFISLLPPVLCPTHFPFVFAGFITFEACVGIFWPSMSYLRGIYVPEQARSTLMSFFRVPLNLFVVAILSNDLPINRIFQFCLLFLGIATVLQHVLSKSGSSTTYSIISKPLPLVSRRWSLTWQNGERQISVRELS